MSQAVDSTHEGEGHGAHKPSPIGSTNMNGVLDASVPHIKKSVSHIWSPATSYKSICIYPHMYLHAYQCSIKLQKLLFFKSVLLDCRKYERCIHRYMLNDCLWNWCQKLLLSRTFLEAVYYMTRNTNWNKLFIQCNFKWLFLIAPHYIHCNNSIVFKIYLENVL